MLLATQPFRSPMLLDEPNEHRAWPLRALVKAIVERQQAAT